VTRARLPALLTDEPSGGSTLEKFDPGATALKIHSLEAAERVAARAKNVEALEAAVVQKLEAQRDFAAGYRAAFPPAGRNSSDARTGAGKKSDAYCTRFGFAQRTVQRWVGFAIGKLLGEGVEGAPGHIGPTSPAREVPHNDRHKFRLRAQHEDIAAVMDRASRQIDSGDTRASRARRAAGS